MSDAHIESRKHKQLQSSRILVGALAGAAFTAALSVFSHDSPPELARQSMYAFVVAIPALCLHLLITAPGHEGRHHVSWLMKCMPLLGAFAAFLGFAMLFETVARGAGILFFLFSVGMTWVAVQAEDRHVKLRKLRSAADAQVTASPRSHPVSL